MRGNVFLNTLETAFPGILRAAYHDRPRSDDGDAVVCALLLPLAQLVGAHLTPEVLGKARRLHGLAAFRSPRTNGTKPDVAPAPAEEPIRAAEQQLPLEAAEPAHKAVDVPGALTNEVVAALLETFAAKLRENQP